MSWGAVGCAVVLGAAAGLLLPRPAYRLSVPQATSPRAGCVHCGAQFPPGAGGWIHLGRACHCRPGAAAVPWLTGAATASTAGLLAATLPADLATAWAVPAVVIVVLAGWLAVLLAAVDLSCLRLPDALVATLALVSVVPLTVVAVATGEPGRLGRAVLGAGLLGLAYLLILILPGGPLGFGDVKLAAVLGFALGFAGWPAVLLGAVTPHLINGPVAVVLLVSRRAGRRAALPFGPALLAGALLAMVVTGQ
ncbi:MAG TPA: A24 family peptidase [Actinoplanes sp.]|nr:A24 family peptidase [Actinoplanes sp.]